MNKYKILVFLGFFVLFAIIIYFILKRENYVGTSKYPIDVSDEFINELLKNNNPQTQLFLKKK